MPGYRYPQSLSGGRPCAKRLQIFLAAESLLCSHSCSSFLLPVFADLRVDIIRAVRGRARDGVTSPIRMAVS